MELQITTIGVRPQYLDTTLRSLFASDGRDLPVTLIMGSPDERYVEQYRNDPRIKILSWTGVPDRSRRVNCTLNKIRALRNGDAEEMVIVEDDVRFNPTWLDLMTKYTATLPTKNYVLSIGQGGRGVPGLLCGSQGVFYPSREVRLGAAEYLTHNLRNATGDVLIGKFAYGVGGLKITPKKLVMHVGHVSCF